MNAISETPGSPKSKSFRAHRAAPVQYETSDEFEDDRYDIATELSIREAQHNARNYSSDSNRVPCTDSLLKECSRGDSGDTPSTDSYDEYLQVPLPTFSNGITTFTHQLALRNRISSSKLSREGEYDMRKYTPTFVYDCLMLPGSLAEILGKVSPLDIIHKMTPALLPGFRAYVQSQELCVGRSSNLNDYVQGMLIFGQGRVGRDRIHDHYRLFSRRVKVHVETDLVVSVPLWDRDFPGERWRLQRRKIWAHAWLTSKVLRGGPNSEVPSWTLAQYLSGSLEDDQTLRIEPAAHGIEEDGGVGIESNDDCISLLGGREVIRSGYGNLDYERVDHGWTGW